MSNVKQFTDKLDKLNFENMYEGDFFLTWEKTRDELEAVFTVADALRHLRENNISAKILTAVLASASSGIIPPARASRLLRPAICSASRCRTLTRAKAKSPTAKPCAKPRT